MQQKLFFYADKRGGKFLRNFADVLFEWPLRMSSSRQVKMATFDVGNLETVEDIRNYYQKLCSEEENITKDLDDLYSHQTQLENKMIALHKMLPNLQFVQADADQLSSMIGFTSNLAETVSSKVRQLDLAKSRVNDCMRRVEDILDVKFCTDGVQSALENEDFEQAAAHIHRFLSLDENVLKSTARDMTEGSALDSSFNVLHEAEAKLKTIVIKKFDEAVRDEDLASVERFFKIFPLLNQHDEGLKKYAIYLCSQIAETAQKNLKQATTSSPADKRASVIFADTVTLLFEGIARFIEINQPLVETYYGPGKLSAVIEILQKECDRQAKKIVEEFKKLRQFQKQIQHVQALTINQYRSTVEIRLDPRDMDVLLGETALLSARAELYIRFIKRRMSNDIEIGFQDIDQKKVQLGRVNKLIKDCELSRIIQELLGYYIMMEEFFLRESVNKAIIMDVTYPDALTSSSVDDIFFIVKKCVRRALSTSSVDGVCAMLNNACTSLEANFLHYVENQLKQGYPSGMIDFTQAYNVLQTSLQQGKLQAADQDKSKTNFLVALNNLESAADFALTLRKSLEEEIQQTFGTIRPQEKEKVESCLSGLNAISNRFKHVLDNGVSQLCANSIRPRIRPWIETFLSVNYEITEEEFSNYEVNDPFIQTLIMNLDNLLTSFKGHLSASNYDSIVTALTNEVTVQLEKVAMKSCFNRLGGLQYDKELRSLVGYLTGTTTWSIREKFARLTQIATILNLERAGEIMDYWGPNSGPVTWRLTPSEVRQVLSLRIDFSSEDIKRLKL